MLQKLAKTFWETWFFWAFIFVLSFITARESVTHPLPRSLDLVFGLVFAYLVALWVSLDARRLERKIGYGFPALVFFIWPIFAPIYLFQSRGLRAFLSLLAFFTTALVTAMIGIGFGLVLP